MIKVLRHGNKTAVRNPITGIRKEMIDVVFVEEGRASGDAHMSETSDFLSRIVGQNVGLENLRTHTHPVAADKINLFPVGAEHQGHINRNMYSLPAIRQQEGIAPRMIDGRPTYFTTYISSKPEDDRDLRLSNSDLLKMDIRALTNAQLGGTLVEILERAETVTYAQQIQQPAVVEPVNEGGEELGD